MALAVLGLLVQRAPCSVSIYLPTGRLPQDAHTNRVELTNLAAVATGQLRDGDADESDVRAIEDAVTALAEDDDAWTEMADTLVVFVTPAAIQTYRLLLLSADGPPAELNLADLPRDARTRRATTCSRSAKAATSGWWSAHCARSSTDSRCP